MMKLDRVTRDDWVLAALGLAVAISLLFFPWFHVSVGIGSLSVSADSSATGSPDGWLGVLAVLAALALVADLAIERLSPETQVPAIADSRATTRLGLAGLAAALIVVKFLLHIHFSLFGWGFYVTVVLVAALVVFALQRRNAEVTVSPTRTGPAAHAGSS